MAFKYLPVLLALVLACAESLPRHHVRSKRSMRLCGSMLVEALAAVCESEYYDPNNSQMEMSMRKRNYRYTAADTYPGYDSPITDFNGFVDPQTALDFLGLKQVMPPRNPRGVADECCRKSCTFNQLLSYCGSSERRSSGEKK